MHPLWRLTLEQQGAPHFSGFRGEEERGVALFQAGAPRALRREVPPQDPALEEEEEEEGEAQSALREDTDPHTEAAIVQGFAGLSRLRATAGEGAKKQRAEVPSRK